LPHRTSLAATVLVGIVIVVREVPRAVSSMHSCHVLVRMATTTETMVKVVVVDRTAGGSE
jgi:hypothetical protein